MHCILQMRRQTEGNIEVHYRQSLRPRHEVARRMLPELDPQRMEGSIFVGGGAAFGGCDMPRLPLVRCRGRRLKSMRNWVFAQETRLSFLLVVVLSALFCIRLFYHLVTEAASKQQERSTQLQIAEAQHMSLPNRTKMATPPPQGIYVRYFSYHLITQE